MRAMDTRTRVHGSTRYSVIARSAAILQCESRPLAQRPATIAQAGSAGARSKIRRSSFVYETVRT
jgi:hypothetical protein